MNKSAYRKILSSLLNELGPEWYWASPAVIYRTDKSYLVQCISCQTSNFSRDYVPATFVQVLARPSDEFRFDFGGRLLVPGAGDRWLSASGDPPTAEIMRLASAQAAIPFKIPLTIDALAKYLDGCGRASFEFPQWWSAGVVYGLAGRSDDARENLERARRLLENLRSRFDKAALSKAGWISDALGQIEKSIAELVSHDRFCAWCRSVARLSALKLGLKSFD